MAIVIWEFVYFAYQWSLSGKTIGMAVLGIRVVRTGGEPVAGSQAVVRTLALPLSFLLFGLGFIGILLNRDRHALHDRLAGTVVVYSWDARAARLRWLAKQELGNLDLRWMWPGGRPDPPVARGGGRPGAVHLPALAGPRPAGGARRTVPGLGRRPGGPGSPRMRRGEMSVEIVGLGWHWYPTATGAPDDGDGGRRCRSPRGSGDLARRAVEAARVDDSSTRSESAVRCRTASGRTSP